MFLNGHGSAEVICGHGDSKLLIVLNRDEKLLKGKIVYARSCDAAKWLGKNCVLKGTRTFIGYKDKFIFVYNQQSKSPIQDKLAKLFLKPSNLVLFSIIRGYSTGQSHAKSKKATNRLNNCLNPNRLRTFG